MNYTTNSSWATVGFAECHCERRLTAFTIRIATSDKEEDERWEKVLIPLQPCCHTCFTFGWQEGVVDRHVWLVLGSLRGKPGSIWSARSEKGGGFAEGKGGQNERLSSRMAGTTDATP